MVKYAKLNLHNNVFNLLSKTWTTKNKGFMLSKPFGTMEISKLHLSCNLDDLKR